MIEIENQEIFAKVIADCLALVDASPTLDTWQKARSVNAIAKASSRIQESGTFMDYDHDKNSLLIWSDSNEIYTVKADTSCHCEAFKVGFICWHRAAKRLIERYFEAINPDPATLPYLKPTVTSTPTSVGNIRI